MSEQDRRKEDSYQMGVLSTKVDQLTVALNEHMKREELTAKDYEDKITRINRYIFLLFGLSLANAPETLFNTSLLELLKMLT